MTFVFGTYILTVLKNILTVIVKTIFSEKILMKIGLGIFDILVKSSKNTFDDRILNIIKKEMVAQGYLTEQDLSDVEKK